MRFGLIQWPLFFIVRIACTDQWFTGCWWSAKPLQKAYKCSKKQHHLAITMSRRRVTLWAGTKSASWGRVPLSVSWGRVPLCLLGQLSPSACISGQPGEGPCMLQAPCTQSWSPCSARAHPRTCNPEVPLPGREGEIPSCVLSVADLLLKWLCCLGLQLQRLRQIQAGRQLWSGISTHQKVMELCLPIWHLMDRNQQSYSEASPPMGKGSSVTLHEPIPLYVCIKYQPLCRAQPQY